MNEREREKRKTEKVVKDTIFIWGNKYMFCCKGSEEVPTHHRKIMPD